MNFTSNIFYMTRMLKDKFMYKIYNYHSSEGYNNVERMKHSNKGVINNLYDLTYESTPIIDNIFLGNAYNASNWREISKNNIKLVVNITEEIPNYYEDDIEYYNIHIKDINEASIKEHLDDFIESVKNFETKNNKDVNKILIHCFMGSSRSASLVVAYLCKFSKMDVDEAIQYIENKRPIININTTFIQQLKEWNNEI